ncbi:MAG: phosphotransferase [Gammaproteobacteria bacterium]|nr:phosphotransferase [Gammaproteobacteria bacterium]
MKTPLTQLVNETFEGAHQALDAVAVQAELSRLPFFLHDDTFPQLIAIRLRRHKPGRRCLIEYDLLVKHTHNPPLAMTLMAKIRMKSHDHKTWAVLNSLWKGGFNDNNTDDNIKIPYPVGEIPHWHMMLQLKVSGTELEAMLAGSRGEHLAKQVAESAFKIHSSDIPTKRCHTMANELDILNNRLFKTADENPHWSIRIKHIIKHCKKLGNNLPTVPLCGIHRDFYADQIIVNGKLLYLLDFDLYCKGDPALDIGNFIAHITEFSLRTFNDADALINVKHALSNRYLQLNPDIKRQSIQTYEVLTLARHIYISTLFSDRKPFTLALLELTEQRLGI